MKNKNGQKKTTTSNKEKSQRETIGFYSKDFELYKELREELADKHGTCTHNQLMRYLLSLHTSKLPKGTQIVERQLKEWLSVGYKKEITKHTLRINSTMNDKTTSLGSVTLIYEKYEDEINKHNSSL